MAVNLARAEAGKPSGQFTARIGSVLLPPPEPAWHAERAGSALERLKLRLAAAEQRSRDVGNSITAQLGWLGEAVRLYAGIADERGIAGAACEKAYDGLKGE